MPFKYNIDNTVLNILSRFYELHGAIYASLHLLPGDILKDLTEKTSELAAFAAVTKNTNLIREAGSELIQNSILSQVPIERRLYYKQYLHILKDFKKMVVTPEFNNDFIVNLHRHVLGRDENNAHFRTARKKLSAEYIEDGIHYTVNSEVKTSPDDIETKLESFVEWLNANYNSENPIILAAMTYFQIAAIHPFQRANGRMSKLLARRILYSNAIDPRLVLSIDDYFVLHQHYYYKVIEKAINSLDLTEWIEFFAKAMLHSAMQTCDLLKQLSGGSIDIKRQRYINLTPREIRALRIIMNENSVSGSYIAKKLKTSRQNVHEIIKSLIDKGLIAKKGKNTGTRYVYSQ